MNLAMNTKLKALLATLLGAVVLVAIGLTPLRWTAKKLHRQVFPEQVPERPVYDETAKAPVDLATFVREARRAWPKAGVSRVHGAALDVATGLLMHADIEVGSMVEGKFAPWNLSPWAAAQRLHDEIAAMPGFLSDQNRYVFRRKAT